MGFTVGKQPQRQFYTKRDSLSSSLFFLPSAGSNCHAMSSFHIPPYGGGGTRGGGRGGASPAGAGGSGSGTGGVGGKQTSSPARRRGGAVGGKTAAIAIGGRGRGTAVAAAAAATAAAAAGEWDLYYSSSRYQKRSVVVQILRAKFSCTRAKREIFSR